jgi:putative ABC transport system substrate-binding protein
MDRGDHGREARVTAPRVLKVVVSILGVACVLLTWPLAGEAQRTGQMPRIGFLGTATPSLMSAWLTAFREGLREYGYVEGQNIAIEYRWGEGKPERFPGLAADLVGLKVDVIVTSGPHAIRATQRASSTIPIVMAIVEDPVEQGFVTSVARPGGNTTGVSFQDTELVTRRLQLLREAVPGVIRVAALWDATGAGRTALTAVAQAAPLMGLVPQVLEVRRQQDLEQAFEAARHQRAQAVIQLASPFFAAHRKTILNLMAKSRLPAVCQERTFVVDGCLMAYGPSFPDMFRRAAYYVTRILKGAKPADLPVEQTSKFDLVMNLKTAKALGITIPSSLLVRADEIIE